MKYMYIPQLDHKIDTISSSSNPISEDHEIPTTTKDPQQASIYASKSFLTSRLVSHKSKMSPLALNHAYQPAQGFPKP